MELSFAISVLVLSTCKSYKVQKCHFDGEIVRTELPGFLQGSFKMTLVAKQDTFPCQYPEVPFLSLVIL